jgi:hypothetical protein
MMYGWENNQSLAIAKTINTKLPVSNPNMSQFEKENVPDTILGICYVFPVIDIIPLFNS